MEGMEMSGEKLENKNFWADRSVLVTGGAGFLGRHIVERLLSYSSDVVVLVKEQSSETQQEWSSGSVHIVYGDLREYVCVEECINNHDVDTIIHLGAQPLVRPAMRSPLPTLETNIVGTLNILEASRRIETVKRVAIASSDKAYGEQEVLPYTESASLNGIAPYELSKVCTDILAQRFSQMYNLPIAVTRCGNFYGPGDVHFDRIVPGTIRSLLRGESPIIRSDGKFLRDYLYVEDAANAYLTLAMNSDRDDVKGQAFNFGTGTPLTVLEIVEKICSACNIFIDPTILDTARGEIRDQYLDSSKSEMVLGWKHQWSVDDALVKTVDWYKKYFGV